MRLDVPKCNLPRRIGPGPSVRSVQLSLQIGKFRMHRTDGIHDSGRETAGLLASAFRTITDPFEIIDALADAILVLGRHDLLCRFAFLFEFIHPVHQVPWNRRIGVHGT